MNPLPIRTRVARPHDFSRSCPGGQPGSYRRMGWVAWRASDGDSSRYVQALPLAKLFHRLFERTLTLYPSFQMVHEEVCSRLEKAMSLSVRTAKASGDDQWLASCSTKLEQAARKLSVFTRERWRFWAMMEEVEAVTSSWLDEAHAELSEVVDLLQGAFDRLDVAAQATVCRTGAFVAPSPLTGREPAAERRAPPLLSPTPPARPEQPVARSLLPSVDASKALTPSKHTPMRAAMAQYDAAAMRGAQGEFFVVAKSRPVICALSDLYGQALRMRSGPEGLPERVHHRFQAGLEDLVALARVRNEPRLFLFAEKHLMRCVDLAKKLDAVNVLGFRQVLLHVDNHINFFARAVRSTVSVDRLLRGFD